MAAVFPSSQRERGADLCLFVPANVVPADAEADVCLFLFFFSPFCASSDSVCVYVGVLSLPLSLSRSHLVGFSPDFLEAVGRSSVAYRAGNQLAFVDSHGFPSISLSLCVCVCVYVSLSLSLTSRHPDPMTCCCCSCSC